MATKGGCGGSPPDKEAKNAVIYYVYVYVYYLEHRYNVDRLYITMINSHLGCIHLGIQKTLFCSS